MLDRVHAVVDPLDWKTRAGYVEESFSTASLSIRVDLRSTSRRSRRSRRRTSMQMVPLLDVAGRRVCRVCAAPARLMALEPTQSTTSRLLPFMPAYSLAGVVRCGRASHQVIWSIERQHGRFAVHLPEWEGARVIGTASAGDMDLRIGAMECSMPDVHFEVGRRPRRCTWCAAERGTLISRF